MGLTARLMSVVLVAAGLAVVTSEPADAVSRTFTPPTDQEYIASLTVTSKPERWRFEARTQRPDDVISYTWFIDLGGPHEHPGAEYRLSLEGGRVTLSTLPSTKPADAFVKACTGKKSGLLGGGTKILGTYVSVPQECLTYLVDEATVERLRVRLVVDGLDETSHSPGKGASKFHAWVGNAPGVPAYPRSAR